MARYQFDHYRFDDSDGSLCHRPSGRRQVLRPQVARLLGQFLEQPGEVLSRDDLYRAIWGEHAVVDFESGLSAVVRELRQILEQTGESAELVETVPRRGYRFRAGSVRRLTGTGVHWPRRPGSLLMVASLALVVAALLATWWLPGGSPAAPDASPARLAILPLERYGDTERAPVQAGVLLADTLLAELWRLELAELELIGRTTMTPYAGREDATEAVARDLGVDLLIEGSVIAGEDGWRVEARLLAVPGGRILWSHGLRHDDELDVAAAAGELANALEKAWPELRAGATD